MLSEIQGAMYDSEAKPPIVDYIYGLGGRDMTPSLIEEVFSDLAEVAKKGKVDEMVRYIGLRE